MWLAPLVHHGTRWLKAERNARYRATRRQQTSRRTTDCTGNHDVMARQVRPWAAKPVEVRAPSSALCSFRCCPLALLGTDFYPVLVHRPAVSLQASPHTRSPSCSCASLRPSWSTYGGTSTLKIAPMLGAQEKGGPGAAIPTQARRAQFAFLRPAM